MKLVRHTKDPIRISPPAPLPLVRKRRLSLSSDSPRSHLITKLLSTVMNISPIGQYTSAQTKCSFLTKLPPEIRNQIYLLVLGDQVLHIVPSPVPSRTLPFRSSDKHKPQDLVSRLDHEPCKHPWRALGVEQLDQNRIKRMTPDPQKLCVTWTNEYGELYVGALVARAQTQEEIETRDQRPWMRKNRPLGLLKTCRIMYVSPIDLCIHPYLPEKLALSNKSTLYLRLHPTDTQKPSPFFTQPTPSPSNPFQPSPSSHPLCYLPAFHFYNTCICTLRSAGTSTTIVDVNAPTK